LFQQARSGHRQGVGLADLRSALEGKLSTGLPGAGHWPQSPASLAYHTARPDHGCITRWMPCASNSKSMTRSRRP